MHKRKNAQIQFLSAHNSQTLFSFSKVLHSSNVCKGTFSASRETWLGWNIETSYHKPVLRKCCLLFQFVFIFIMNQLSLFCTGRPTCSCALGFTGPRCNQSVCERFCQNGGTCSVTAGNQPFCSCLPEYTGDRCQYCK